MRDAPPGESYYPFDVGLATSGMPSLARRILESCNLADLATRRRDNFTQYTQLLARSNQMQILHNALLPESCPWVFPVLLERRSERDHRWRADGVALYTFGIYLHSALFKSGDSATIADAIYLAEHMLCFAIHQDIEAGQIEKSAATINRSLAYLGNNSQLDDERP